MKNLKQQGWPQESTPTFHNNLPKNECWKLSCSDTHPLSLFSLIPIVDERLVQLTLSGFLCSTGFF